MKMKIEIKKIRETPCDESLHLRISTPDGNCYNFRVPQTDRDTYEFNYGYKAMCSLHEILDKFINKV